MSYTTAYDKLCSFSSAADCTLTLSHFAEGWGLQIVAPPSADIGWRAAGVIFESIDKLDWHAARLLDLVLPAAQT